MLPLAATEGNATNVAFRGCSGAGVLGLQRPKAGVEPLCGKQFGVRTTLGDAPVSMTKDAVGVDDGGQSVSDDQCGALAADRANLGLNRLFALGIKR